MIERLATMADPELEDALRDLGAALEQPAPTVDIALAARLRIVEAQARRATRPTWRVPLLGRTVRRSIVFALAALVILAGLAAAIGLGLPGLRITFLVPAVTPQLGASPAASPPPTTASPSATRSPTPIEALDLGRPVDVAALDAEAGFHVRLPSDLALGSPIGAFVDGTGRFARVSIVYPPSSEFPGQSASPASTLITEFRGAIEPAYFMKYILPGTTVEPVQVDGRAGYWISGAPHELSYTDANGQLYPDKIRVAGNVLAWNDGQLTYRIEGAPNVASALEIAASMR